MEKINKINIFFILLIATTPNLHAQLEPFFEMTLHFEDAVGNRDSVSFGYDINATADLEAEWGEFEITAPFDSVFEVRIAEPTINKDKLTKHLVTLTGYFVNDTSCYEGAGIRLYINAVHQPIKIWWDKEQLLDNECFRGGFVINHVLDELAGPIAPNEIPPLFYCMAAVDTAYFDVSEETMSTSEWPVVSIEKEVEGQGVQTVYGLRLNIVPWWSFTPCYWVTTVNEIVKIDEISLYPNPTVDKITPIMTDKYQEIQKAVIYDSMGRQLWQDGALNFTKEIDVSSFKSGLYRLVIYSEDSVFVGSFVKR